MADITITPEDVGIGANASGAHKFQVGVAIKQGEVIAPRPADNLHVKAVNSDADLSKARAVAITPAAANGWVYAITAGPVKIGGTVAVGETYVVSGTDGAIAPIADLAAGDYVTHLGVGSATDEIEINIAISGIVKA